MAATGKTPILLYGSTTTSNVPVAGNLTNSSDGCELAINVADKNLFFKDSTNSVNTVPIRQSSGSSDGWLSSTDWSTFNGKQAALVSGTNIKTVSGTTLLGSGDLGTIGVGYGGTGTSTAFTTGSVVFAGASGVYTQDNTNLFWDNSNKRLGIGTTTPSYNQHINYAGVTSTYLYNSTNSVGVRIIAYTDSGYVQTQTNHPLNFAVNNGNAGLQLDTSNNVNVKLGNLVIGTSGKGIDFSATAGTGTSELLADYEEGTWTVTWTNLTGTPTSTTGYYTKFGRAVYFTYPAGAASISGTGNSVRFTLPFTPASNSTVQMTSDAVTNTGVGLIYTSGVAYPSTFNAGGMIFSGTYYV